MGVRIKVASVCLLGCLVLTGFDKRVTETTAKKSESARGLDLKELPLPVIETAQKAVPSIAFMTVEKQSSWRRGQFYRIWGMDEKSRTLYMEISAAGKLIERPKVVKEKEKEAQGNIGQAQTKLQPQPQTPVPTPVKIK